MSGKVTCFKHITDRPEPVEGQTVGLASISTVLEMTNGTADLGEADDKLLVAEPRHGCWGVGKF